MPPRLKGDSSKRITVALPQRLTALARSANGAFGGGRGGWKLYHQGENLLQDQKQFENVRDRDVVVVKRDSRDISGPTFQGTTTHQIDFVKHPLEKRRPPEAPPRSNYQSPTFQGRSCYAGDFVEHPLQTQKKEPPPVWQPGTVPMTARSTYNDNYPWHALQPKKPIEKATGPGCIPPPFQGQSSYKIDYIKHNTARPKSAVEPRRNVETTTVPFSGATTYAVDYKKHATERRRAETPKRVERSEAPPFRGNSEYTTQYLPKEKPRTLLVHLEPVDKYFRDGEVIAC